MTRRADLLALAEWLDPIAQVHMELHDIRKPRSVLANIDLTGPELNAIVKALRAMADDTPDA